MRKNSLAFVGICCLLAGCHADLAQAQAETSSEPVIVAKEPSAPGAGTTLCAPNDGVLISCKLKGEAYTASICITPGNRGEARTARFLLGVPGDAPVMQHTPDSSSKAMMFRSTHLLRAGPTGAYVYTFEHNGLRYGFYTEEGSDHALAGLFKSKPASRVAISDRPCDMKTLVISYDRKLTDLTRTWQEDPQISKNDLPMIESNNSE